jgi:hypothetical protein
MADETGLFIDDLTAGREVPGGTISAGLSISPEDFEARFGRLFWRPDGTLDPIYYKLAAFCKTTAVSENSPANLGAKNVRFHRAPTTLDDVANTTVLGRKFREAGAATGVCQVRSQIGPEAAGPVLSWSRECIVNGRSGWTLPDDGTSMDDREKIAVQFDAAEVELSTETPSAVPSGALAASDFKLGEPIPTGRISVLRPDEIFWITRGLGNKAKTHYTRDSGYIVWGLLTLLYGVWNYAEQLRGCQLLGLDIAKHIAPVYLSEQVREEEHATGEAPAPPEFLSSTLTPREVEDYPGRPGVKLVTAALDVYNNVNEIGVGEYERQKATKALGGIADDGRLHVGDYVLRLAAFERA